MSRRNTDHIKFSDTAATAMGNSQTLSCDHCGAWIIIGFPVEVRKWLAVVNAFAKAHRNCEPAEEPIQETK